MGDLQNLDLPSVLLDPVDDPVLPAPRPPAPFERPTKGYADDMGPLRQRTLDELPRSERRRRGQRLAQCPPRSRRQHDGVRDRGPAQSPSSTWRRDTIGVRATAAAPGWSAARAASVEVAN